MLSLLLPFCYQRGLRNSFRCSFCFLAEWVLRYVLLSFGTCFVLNVRFNRSVSFWFSFETLTRFLIPCLRSLLKHYQTASNQAFEHAPRRRGFGGGYSAKPNDTPDDHTKAVLQHVLGPTPRPLMPVTVEAQFFGMAPDSLKTTIRSGASAVHFGERAWVGSLLSHLNARTCGPGCQYEPFSTVSWTTYDETPLPFRTEDFSATKTFPDIPETRVTASGLSSLNDKVGPNPKAKKEQRSCKVVQSDGAISICLKHRENGSFVILEVPLHMPLQLVDRTTAEAIAACQTESMSIPFYHTLRDKFKHKYDASTCDQAAPNLKSEAFLGVQRLQPSSTIPHTRLYIYIYMYMYIYIWEIPDPGPRAPGSDHPCSICLVPSLGSVPRGF